MRIAIISTLGRPVPPKAEGSVELLVSQLSEYLVSRGHEVTLFALADSNTSAALCSPVQKSYVTDPGKWDWQLYEAFQVREAFAQWEKFDVINCHSYYFGLLFADTVPIPSIHSFHIEPGPDYEFLCRHTRNRHLHFCSRYQARHFMDQPDVHIIPHGIDLSKYSVAVDAPKEKYLAWMGRFHPDKGVLDAIDLAKAARVPLRLAGPSNDYLCQTVLPKCDPASVTYVGELSGREKSAFLANARALLYPVERGEPFGLVLVEAMACGLPVVAYNRGAVPEIVEHGVTGWIGETRAELINGIAMAPTLDRNRIRAETEARFTSQRMGEQMENLMLKVIEANAEAPADRLS